MKRFVIDCSGIQSEEEFWAAYVREVQPDGSGYFGRNMAALRDALLAGGPGWPGECELAFVNTRSIKALEKGSLYRGLEKLSDESESIRVILE